MSPASCFATRPSRSRASPRRQNLERRRARNAAKKAKAAAETLKVWADCTADVDRLNPLLATQVPNAATIRSVAAAPPPDLDRERRQRLDASAQRLRPVPQMAATKPGLMYGDLAPVKPRSTSASVPREAPPVSCCERCQNVRQRPRRSQARCRPVPLVHPRRGAILGTSCRLGRRPIWLRSDASVTKDERPADPLQTPTTQLQTRRQSPPRTPLQTLANTRVTPLMEVMPRLIAFRQNRVQAMLESPGRFPPLPTAPSCSPPAITPTPLARNASK